MYNRYSVFFVTAITVLLSLNIYSNMFRENQDRLRCVKEAQVPNKSHRNYVAKRKTREQRIHAVSELMFCQSMTKKDDTLVYIKRINTLLFRKDPAYCRDKSLHGQ